MQHLFRSIRYEMAVSEIYIFGYNNEMIVICVLTYISIFGVVAIEYGVHVDSFVA